MTIDMMNVEDFSSIPPRFFYTPHKSHFAPENGVKYGRKKNGFYKPKLDSFRFICFPRF
jgi:hypothetical protein